MPGIVAREIAVLSNGVRNPHRCGSTGQVGRDADGGLRVSGLTCGCLTPSEWRLLQIAQGYLINQTGSAVNAAGSMPNRKCNCVASVSAGAAPSGESKRMAGQSGDSSCHDDTIPITMLSTEDPVILGDLRERLRGRGKDRLTPNHKPGGGTLASQR